MFEVFGPRSAGDLEIATSTASNQRLFTYLQPNLSSDHYARYSFCRRLTTYVGPGIIPLVSSLTRCFFRKVKRYQSGEGAYDVGLLKSGSRATAVDQTAGELQIP